MLCWFDILKYCESSIPILSCITIIKYFDTFNISISLQYFDTLMLSYDSHLIHAHLYLIREKFSYTQLKIDLFKGVCSNETC